MENEKKALELVKAGLPVTSIAAQMGVTRATVYNWLKRQGWEPTETVPNDATLPVNMPVELKTRLEAAAEAAGMSQAAWVRMLIEKALS